MIRVYNNKRKVAIYGRVSSEHEAQLSAFENQILWYDKQIEKHPEWIVVGKYFDKGITGVQAKKRVNFLNMIEDAKKGLFDLIITREVSRFARNTLETLKYTRMLKALGVEVYFMEDGISTFDKDGEIRLTNMAANAQEESRKLSERVKAGQYIARHEKGVIYGTGNILGYNRRKEDGMFIVDEEQAETVKLIYQLYLEGKGIRRIQLELTKLERRNSVGEVKWYDSTISRILDNPFYTGRQYQQQTTVVDYLEQKRVTNDKNEYVIVKGNYEPIISIEDFEKVAELKSKKTSSNFKGKGLKPTSDNWMKIMECGCGSRFQQYKWRKLQTTGEIIKGYACRNRVVNRSTEFRMKHGLPLDDACDRKTISQWYLELMIKDILKEIWSFRKDTVIKTFEIIKDSYVDDEVDHQNKLIELETKIKKAELKIGRLVDLYTDGIIEKVEFYDKREQYKDLLKTSEEEFEQINGGAEQFEKSLNDKLDNIKNSLEQKVDFETERIEESIIEQLVDKVIVREDNEYEWLLNLTDTSNKDVFGISLNEKYKTKSQKSIEARDTKYNFVFESVVSVERAHEYRKKYGKHIKYQKWNNIKFKVYVR